ncbi:hypothetical protein GWI33_018008 [Rhynchophorus ferrugineus]|uniref:26S proteasome non-ATPase regulatory subunit 5 n=1 Tax=Rhynchophorus ferrugineus TaxID=354439 RepID=A0A834M5Q3_RHYFE|nr:hypothetical protein GWI33_018008 [Rhynchophorus ferrugineus]
MQTNEITRLRIFEVIINISTQSDYSFKKLIDAKYMEKIICDLQNDDILLKMNIVEMLSELGQSEHGYVYLDKSRSLDKIISILTEDNLTMQLCEPGILKFFGHIAYKRPMEVMNQYDMLFNRLFMHLSCDDMTIFGISLDIIGHIGKTAEGKIALQSIDKIETAIKTVSSRLSSIPTDIKIRALSCLESLLRVTDNNNEITSLTHEWYSFIGANPMDVILRYAKNPFSELRLSGLGILNALANQTWGQEAIKNSAGLVEFLLDRNIESIKECKESKYEIIKLLSQSIIFDENTLERLQNFVKEGPFYVQALTEVAIEGN